MLILGNKEREQDRTYRKVTADRKQWRYFWVPLFCRDSSYFALPWLCTCNIKNIINYMCSHLLNKPMSFQTRKIYLGEQRNNISGTPRLSPISRFVHINNLHYFELGLDQKNSNSNMIWRCFFMLISVESEGGQIGARWHYHRIEYLECCAILYCFLLESHHYWITLKQILFFFKESPPVSVCSAFTVLK